MMDFAYTPKAFDLPKTKILANVPDMYVGMTVAEELHSEKRQSINDLLRKYDRVQNAYPAFFY